MRALVLLVSLTTLAACTSDDTAVDPSSETAPDEVQSAPVVAPGDPGAAPDADALDADAATDATPTASAPTPTTAPPPPLAPVEPTPVAPTHPEGEHVMDDGTMMHGDMPMDGEHTMDDGMPMDHGDHDG